MGQLAILLKSLKSQKSEDCPQNDHFRCLVIEVLDTIIEEIFRGIERNDFKESQQRITQIKFIAETYNY